MHYVGLLSLCAPLTIFIILSSPAYSSNRSLVCQIGMIQSQIPTTNNAGTSSFPTPFFIGLRSQMLNSAFYLMVPEMIFKAALRTIFGIFEFFCTISSTKAFKLLNGLSKTAALTPQFLAKYSKAVTAPIDLPQSAILLIFGQFLRYSTTSFRSSCQQYPSEMYSPSAFPHPLKSKVQSAILLANSLRRYSVLNVRNDLPLESIAAVSVEIDHTRILLQVNGKPKRAGEIVASLVAELKVLAMKLLALDGEDGRAKRLLSVGCSCWSDDVFPQLIVLLLQLAQKVHLWLISYQRNNIIGNQNV